MKKANLDERQLWMRGEVFKHSLFFMGFLLLLKAVLTDGNIPFFDSEWADIFIISLTAAFVNIEMSLKGAFDFDDKRMSIMVILMGVCGLIILIINIFHIINGEGLFSDGKLTNTGQHTIIFMAFLAIPVVYFAKRSQFQRRQQSAETEENNGN